MTDRYALIMYRDIFASILWSEKVQLLKDLVSTPPDALLFMFGTFTTGTETGKYGSVLFIADVIVTMNTK